MKATTSELRIPADPQYIVVAKRAAAGFAYVAGFGVEAVDELCIAVTQACENAISCVSNSPGSGTGQVRIVFRLEDQQLQVQVRSSCQRDEVTAGAATGVDEERRVSAVVAEQRAVAMQQARVQDLALRMMGLFVDDCRYRVDERTGSLRVRLTKYRVS